MPFTKGNNTMKKLLLILLCLPMVGFGQLTMIPDPNFEQKLIDLGYDNLIDGSVNTASIDTITSLDVDFSNISDLTGIEDFTALTTLWCGHNQLTSLDVSQNTALTTLWCFYNQLVSLNLGYSINCLSAEGNLLQSLDLSVISNIDSMSVLQLVNNGGTLDNPYLTCIQVPNNSIFTSPNFQCSVSGLNNFHCVIGSNMYFSTNCSSTSLKENTTTKNLLKVTDLIGRETNNQNQPLIYFYNDGTVEKKLIVD